jgi:Rrf2 family protein
LRFQKTTEYAIRVMVFLSNNKNDLYSTNRLHQILNIPYKYLGRLMHTLTKAGFLEVTMGKQGGYRIRQDRATIYLHEIVDAIEGLENYNRCVLGFPECADENPCPLHQFWLKQQEGLKKMVYKVSLKDLERGLNIKF